MKKLKWYFKHGTAFETFSVLYEDAKFMLVKNDNTGTYDYGVKEDFGTLCGFPVNQSCLNAPEAIDMLQRFTKIDTSYLDSLGDIARTNIKRWSDMIQAITLDCDTSNLTLEKCE